MSDPNSELPFLEPLSLSYQDPGSVPRPPGIFIALGVVSLIAPWLSWLANATGIFIVIGLYVATLAGPSSAGRPVFAQPPSPLVPYHGDYAPAGGMNRSQRAVVIRLLQADGKRSPDRVAMWDRILAEAGMTAFGSEPSALTTLGQTTPPNGPPVDVLTLPAGVITVANDRASFRPVNGSPTIEVLGNLVRTSAGTAFNATCVDQTMDQIHASVPGLNALQARVLADRLRGLSVPAGSLPWITPAATPGRVSQVPSVSPLPDGAGTVTMQTSTAPYLQYLLPTGAVTSVQPVIPPPPTASRRPRVEIDSSLIFGSLAEYIVSAGASVLLLIAGIFALKQNGFSLRLYGFYVLLKVPLVLINLTLGVATATQLSNASFVTVIVQALGTCVQAAMPLAVLLVAGSFEVRRYFESRGRVGTLFFSGQKQLAACLSPDRWSRPVAVIAGVWGLLLIVGCVFDPRWTSPAWCVGIASGLLVTVYATITLLRRRQAVAALLILLSLALLCRSSAATPPANPTAEQLLDAAKAAPVAKRQDAFFALIDRSDALVPLMKFVTDEPDPDLQNAALYPLLTNLPNVGDAMPPAAVESANALVPVLIKMVGQSEPPQYSIQMLTRIASNEQLLPTLRQWLASNARVSGESVDSHHRRLAMELLHDLKPRSAEVLQLMADQVDEPDFREQVLNSLNTAGADGEPLLVKILREDHSARVRSAAVSALASPDRPGHRRPLSADAIIALQKVAAADADQSVRKAADLALSTTAGSDAGPGGADVAALVQGLRNPTRRPELTELLLQTDPRKTVPALTALLTDADAGVRNAAERAMVCQDYDRYQCPFPAALIDAELNEPDSQLRQDALTLIRSTPSAATWTGAVTRQKLEELLYHEPVPPVSTPYADVDPTTGQPASGSTVGSLLPKIFSGIEAMIRLSVWPLIGLLCLGSLASRSATRDPV